MENNKLELFIVIAIITYLLYFVLYLTYFDNYCSKYSVNIASENVNIEYLAKCKDSLVCEITNQGRNNNNLETWTCAKKRHNNFELDFYISEYNKFIKNF